MRLLPSHKDWEIRVRSSLIITLQRDGSQELKKDAWVTKLAPGFFSFMKDLDILQRDRDLTLEADIMDVNQNQDHFWQESFCVFSL